MKNIKKSLLVLACIVLLAGCGKDVKLKNGENAIVTLKDGAISSDDYYKELKKANSAQVLRNMIDKKLLDSLYEQFTHVNLSSCNILVQDLVNGVLHPHKKSYLSQAFVYFVLSILVFPFVFK